MTFLQAPPHPHLQEHIAQYIHVALENTNELNNLEQTFFPLDIPCISFYSKKLRIGKNGTSKEACSIYTGLIKSASSLTFRDSENICAFIISLKPHGFAELFRLDQAGIDEPIDFYSIMEKEAEWLHQHLEKANSFHKQISIADAYFLKKKPAQDYTAPIRKVCWQIIHNNGLVEIKALADEANLSLSSLERRFSKTVGIPPKQFARIKRFHYALKLMNTSKLNLTEIAHTCGYFDQAHFIRDFQKFTGLTPSAFRPENYPFHKCFFTDYFMRIL